MGDGVRPGKNSTCFTVLSLAIAEEQRVGSGIIVPQLTGLSHKTTGQHGSVVDMGTGGNNKIIANNAVSDMHRGRLVTVDAPIVQTARPADPAEIPDTHILDRTGIENHHMVADGSHRGSVFIGIIVCNLFHPADQFRTMPVKSQDIGLMGREFVVNQHFTTSRLVQYGSFYSVAKLSQAVHQDDIYILNESIVSYLIVGNVVLDVLDTAIITNSHIMQGDMSQAGMFLIPPGRIKSEWNTPSFTSPEKRV